MEKQKQMKQQKRTQYLWVLMVRSALFCQIGMVLSMADSVSPTFTSGGIGTMTLLSGVCAVWFGLVNQRIETSGFWLMLGGLVDIVFGLAMLLSVDESMKSSIYVLGVWAFVFAFLEIIQTLQAFVTFKTSPDYMSLAIHALLVIASGWLAVALLMESQRPIPLALTGLLPVAMGGLFISQTLKLQMSEMANSY